jgi:hypothetical protein
MKLPMLHTIKIKDIVFNLTYLELCSLSRQLENAVQEADLLEYVASKERK